MLINKTLQEIEVPLTASAIQDGTAEVYVYSTLDTSTIRQLPDVAIAGGALQLTLEPYSMTLVEIPASEILVGDINLNGVVDFFDISPFIELLSNGEFQAEGDFDGDGVVGFLDISGFIAALSN